MSSRTPMPSTPSRSRSSRSKSRSAAPSERRLSLLLLLVAAHQRMAQLVDRELAAELGMPLTTASDIVRRLEARKLVRRRPNPDDARSWLFELSASGDREWRRGWGALQRINERLAAELRDLDATRASLTELGDAFAAALADE